MKWFNIISSSLIIIASVILCQQIISNSITNQKDKADFAELSSIKYGILNIEEWKQQIAKILIEEINKIDLSKKNEQDLKNAINELLNSLINNLEKKIKDNYSNSMWGRFKLSLVNNFFSMDTIKKGIPEYSDTIFREITKAKTKSQVRYLLNQQVKKLSSQIYNKYDTSRLKGILSRTESADIASAKSKLENKIKAMNNLIRWESLGLVALSVILFSISGFLRKPLSPSRYLFLVITLIPLLVTGVATPMIDMEIKISKISFSLIGHSIDFMDQVLYFQTKSILDVFRLMIHHEDFQMKFVGILMITFSIFFPMFKIISSMVYYFNFRKAKENPLIKFFVFKSGKWSMADVMVVAIFMAYIGFNGIIKSQLGYLNWVGQKFGIITANGTNLQPGYYIFLTYTLLALFLGVFLARDNKVSD